MGGAYIIGNLKDLLHGIPFHLSRRTCHFPFTARRPASQLPARNRGGAPKGNANRLRHGLRGCGALPAGCSYIRRSLDEFRRQLEGEMLVRHGIVNLFAAACIQSAMRHERRSMLLQKILRDADKNSEKLSIMDSAGFSQTKPSSDVA